MFYVYILSSKVDGRLYIGSTVNLKKRYMLHTKGQVSSTRNRRPLELLYYEAYTTEHLARIREKRLKHFGSAYAELKKRLQLN